MTVSSTYSTYARGTDNLGFISNFLDLTPLGRQEPWKEPKGRATAFRTGARDTLRYTRSTTTGRLRAQRHNAQIWPVLALTGIQPVLAHRRVRVKLGCVFLTEREDAARRGILYLTPSQS